MNPSPDVSWNALQAQRTVLYGGYYARLTESEVNEWSEYCYDLPEYAALICAREQLFSAKDLVSASAFVKAEKNLYYVSKKWHEALVDRKAAPDEAQEEKP